MWSDDTFKIINTAASVFSAVGTVGAVVTALYMTSQQSKQKCTVSVVIGMLGSFDGQNEIFIQDESCDKEMFSAGFIEKYKALSVTVTNKGSIDISLESIHFKAKHSKRIYMIKPNICSPNYQEIRFLPHTSISIFINLSSIITNRFIVQEANADKLILTIQTSMRNSFSTCLPRQLITLIQNSQRKLSPTPPPSSSPSNSPV